MSIYKCPKCETEFSLGTKFCEKCGCNLEVEFIETPTCSVCRKTFPTGTKFCKEHGIKLVSPEKTIPKCVKCEKEYSDDTKFCPLDGGKIIPEALRTGIDFDNAKELVGKGKELVVESVGKGNRFFSGLSKKAKIGVIGGFVVIIVLIIVLFSDFNTEGTTDKGVVINGVRWATRNVDRPGTFAATPENRGMFFVIMCENEDGSWGTGACWDKIWAGWIATIEEDGAHWITPEATLVATANPCPRGWRIPTLEELRNLKATDSRRTAVNGVYGRTFGTAPHQIFLPGGSYFAYPAFYTANTWGLIIRTDSSMDMWYSGATVFSIRCVAE